MNLLMMVPNLYVSRWAPYATEMSKHVDVTFLVNDPQNLCGSSVRRIEFRSFLDSRVTKHNALEFPQASEVKRAVKRLNPDVIHAVCEPSYPHVQPLLDAAKCPVTCRLAQNIFQKWPIPFSYYESRALRKLSHVFPVSEISENLLREKGYDGPSTIVGNGFAPEICFPKTAKRDKLVFIGSVIERKGVFDLLQAMVGLRRRGFQDPLYILGEADRQNSQRVQSFCEENHLTDIHLVGRVPHSDMVEYIRTAKFVVIPSKVSDGSDWSYGRYFKAARVSWSEQFCMVVVEALACGTPVITSDSGALPDVAGPRSFRFAANDPFDLEEKVDSALSISEPEYRDLVSWGIDWVEQFSWESVCKGFLRQWGRMT